LSFFNTLEAGFYRKLLLVFRNLEAKLLKTDNLRGLIREMEPGPTLGVHAENTTVTNRIVL